MVSEKEMLSIIRSELGDKRFKDVTKNAATFTLWVKMAERYRQRQKEAMNVVMDGVETLRNN